VRPGVVVVAPPGLEERAGLGERGERLTCEFSAAGGAYSYQPNSTFRTGNPAVRLAAGDGKTRRAVFVVAGIPRNILGCIVRYYLKWRAAESWQISRKHYLRAQTMHPHSFGELKGSMHLHGAQWFRFAVQVRCSS
jgi:hypothetical protein